MHIWTVSDISSAITGTLNKTFADVAVSGEVTNLSIASNGHMYFTLKDEKSAINCVCFAGFARKMNITIDNGMEITVYGNLTTYEQRSQYQIQIKTARLNGLGQMMEIFKARRAKFEEMGYFAQENKQKIPEIPKKVGIITSNQGAVIHDICSKLDDKIPMEVLIYHSFVQGNNAAIDIIGGIDYFETVNNVDVILIARGGGSFEDLFCFNDEKLIERIYKCKTPVISAVGHENDYTLCDFVSDFRASTPTHAANIISKTKKDVQNEINNALKSQEVNILQQITTLDSFLKHYFGTINQIINTVKFKAQELKLLWTEIRGKFDKKYQIITHQISLKTENNKAIYDVLRNKITYYQSRLANYIAYSEKVVILKNREAINKLNGYFETVKLYDFNKMLDKGYSILTNQSGQIISNASKLQKADVFQVQTKSSIITAEILQNQDKVI